jgi:hypothetical protein
MTEVEAAWVGAMLDADGWVTVVVGSGPLIVIGNTGLEIISALLRATGLGRVYYSPPPSCKGSLAQWRWSVLRKKEAEELCRRVITYSIKAQWLLAQGWARRGVDVHPSAKNIIEKA